MRTKKAKSKKGISPVLLHENLREKEKVDKLKEIYSQDKVRARVFAFQDKISYSRVMMFEESKTKFQIVREVLTYGVSVSYKIYFRIKKDKVFTVNNGKFYMHFSQTKPNLIRGATYAILDELEKQILYERYPWIKFFEESKISAPFNVCYTYSLFTPSKVLSHVYKCSARLAKTIHEIFVKESHFNQRFSIKIWKEAIKWVYNLDNINMDILMDWNTFVDTCKMAEKLNKKVNAAWSKRRLIEEHDRWAREITGYLLLNANEPLNIKPIYLEFNDFLGGDTIIRDTKTLVLEGLVKNHCVGGYTSQINNGNCAIFSYKDHTLQITTQHVWSSSQLKGLHMAQFKGRHNMSPPSELYDEIEMKLAEFNSTLFHEDRESHYEPARSEAELPF